MTKNSVMKKRELLLGLFNSDSSKFSIKFTIGIVIVGVLLHDSISHKEQRFPLFW